VNLFEEVCPKVEAEQYYLQPELTMPELAAYTGMRRTELSRIVNQGGGVSFYDFVNRMRIFKAKAVLLSDEEEYQSILELAYSCGFNLKSAFHSAFKKWTGMTPLQFKKSRNCSPPADLSSRSETRAQSAR
jgi:AraC-like DNA-binding protein